MCSVCQLLVCIGSFPGLLVLLTTASILCQCSIFFQLHCVLCVPVAGLYRVVSWPSGVADHSQHLVSVLHFLSAPLCVLCASCWSVSVVFRPSSVADHSQQLVSVLHFLSAPLCVLCASCWSVSGRFLAF